MAASAVLSRRRLRYPVVMLASLGSFALFALGKGVDPLTMYSNLVSSTFGSGVSVSQILDTTAPLALCGLAVALPAWGGMVNIGGQGQLTVGAVAAAGVVQLAPGDGNGWLVMSAMLVASALGGAAWAGLSALLRVRFSVNETISTLLLNFVALDLMLYLVYGPWRSAQGTGQPVSELVPTAYQIPLFPGTQINIGLVVAVVASGAGFVFFRYSRAGFMLRVVGRNQAAARRSGIRADRALLWALLGGGAIAGVGGMIQYAGLELQLSPSFALEYGYIGFLASWMAAHTPLALIPSAGVLAAIAVGGDNLQITSALPGSSVYILMGFLVLGILLANRSKEQRS